MKVIRVAQVMGYMNGGGVEQVVMNYYRHVDRTRVQFDFIVCEGSEMVPEDEITSLGGRVFMVPPYSHVVAYGRALENLYQSQRWSIVHSHLNALSVFSLRAAKTAEVPVRIAHSHSTSGQGEFAKNIIKNILRTQSRRYPNYLMACSQHAGEWLFGKEAEFQIIPNAFEIKKFIFNSSERSRVRSELGIHDESIVIGHIGRFMTQKNHLFLIDAFSRLLDFAPNVLLILVGEGELKAEVERKVRANGVEDRVIFLGQRSDVSSLYQAFDVFAFPSLYEGLGMVLIEAQVAGLPCVVSDCVPHESNVSGAVHYLPLGDSDMWAHALVEAARGGRLPVNLKLGEFTCYDIERAADKMTVWYETHSSVK